MCVHAYVCVCVSVCARVHKCLCMHMPVCICVCVHVCVCVISVLQVLDQNYLSPSSNLVPNQLTTKIVKCLDTTVGAGGVVVVQWQ